MPAGSYDLVHPLWGSHGCTDCHVPNSRLNLSGGSASCGIVRDGTDIAGGQYLNNPLCSNASSILSVPAGGVRPDNTLHPGGKDGCFASNSMCSQTILAWCRAGAACP